MEGKDHMRTVVLDGLWRNIFVTVGLHKSGIVKASMLLFTKESKSVRS